MKRTSGVVGAGFTGFVVSMGSPDVSLPGETVGLAGSVVALLELLDVVVLLDGLLEGAPEVVVPVETSVGKPVVGSDVVPGLTGPLPPLVVGATLAPLLVVDTDVVSELEPGPGLGEVAFEQANPPARTMTATQALRAREVQHAIRDMRPSCTNWLALAAKKDVRHRH